jgi:hypothetical protein
MGTAISIIFAVLVVASIAFLAFGLFRPQRGANGTEKVHEPGRWTVRATLATMRRRGASLPAEVGAEANRSEVSSPANPAQQAVVERPDS